MEAQDRHDIVEVKTYVNRKGHEVKEFNQVYGKEKEPPFYAGVCMAIRNVMHPGGQVEEQPFRFDFPFPKDTTLKVAFETFDAEATKALEAMKKEASERAAKASRIVPARTMPKILGPDGKPLKG